VAGGVLSGEQECGSFGVVRDADYEAQVGREEEEEEGLTNV